MKHRIRTNLTYLRTVRRKISQRDLSDATGIAQNTLSKLESNQTSGIDFVTLIKLCDYFDCAPNDILIIEPEEGRSSSYVRLNQALISELALGISKLASEIQPTQFRPGQIHPGQLHPGQIHPGQLHSRQIRPNQFNFSPEDLAAKDPVQDPWANLDEKEKKVYEFVGNEPVHFDVLIQHTDMPAGELSATLTMLELAGAVRRLTGDWYSR